MGSKTRSADGSTPQELRAQGRRIMNEAQAEPDRRQRRLLHRKALELAQLADMMEAEVLPKPVAPVLGYPGQRPHRRQNVKRKAPPERG
jgi:hypothetical protein